MAFATPLRYPGGKGRLGPWLAELMRANGISGGTYVEPYAGGAGAAIYLLTQGFVDRIVINDADPAIHAFWWAVLNDTDRFLKKLDRCSVTLAARERHKSIIAAPKQHEKLDVGFAAFFLNRTNRSGILQGGVIGGKEQAGTYKIDARFNREDMADRISKIGKLRDHIELHGLDAMKLLSKIQKTLPKKSLIYFDPPYYIKGSQLYRNFYTPGDHKEIAENVTSLRTPWLVTYDNCDEIRTLYQGTPTLTFSLYYSTHLSRDTATEVMFYDNLDMKIAPYLRR
ncbi:DNA adenine methylase [Lysobacter auxotrophicus]|uniref:DNA adenine methylase n=1 Tax=Lysobacter auxotrophicus TaxID=2992573 RepID=UPI002493425B|nr:DNA adenine methylase [Lysobacter auxotrophicus]